MSNKSLVNNLVSVYSQLGIEWEGYGSPNEVDVEAALLSMQEYLEDYTGSVAMELPGTSIRLDRGEDGRYNVYFKIGTLSNDEEDPIVHSD